MANYTYQGKTQSLAAWARELEIPYTTLRDRLARGEGDNAFKSNTIEYKGKRYTRSQLAREYKINPSLFINRLNMGWTIEKALTEPVRDYVQQ